MDKIWGGIILLRGRYDAMTPGEQTSAMFQAGIDLMILVFFFAAVYTGVTRDINAFYFWVPVFAFALWVRFKQARQRWNL